MQRAPEKSDARWLAGSLLLFFVGFSIEHFLAAGRDDTFIALWAGQTLGAANWFVNFNFVPQEIASSHLLALVAAPTRGLPIADALLVVKATGLLSSCVQVFAIWLCRQHLFENHGSRNALAIISLGATAFSPPFQYWSLGGLETPYYSLLLFAYCVLLANALSSNDRHGHTQHGLQLALVGILLALSRTEAFWLLFMGISVALLCRRTSTAWHVPLRNLILAAAMIGVLFAVRFAMTGALWPNPVYAKVDGIGQAIPAGIAYLVDYYSSSLWTRIQALGALYGILRAGQFIRELALHHTIPSRALTMEAILGATTLGHQAFVILVGGNWMEYFRFIAAIVPLLNILVACMLATTVRAFVVRHPVATSIGCLTLAAAQTGTASELYAGNCATPITAIAESVDRRKLVKHVIEGNCAYQRDWHSIKPFIESQLPQLISEAGGQLLVASPQAGIFPYLLRMHYAPNTVWFVDTAGITDLEIARVAGPRSSIGRVDGSRIDLALVGDDSPMSIYLSKKRPNLVYLLGASNEVRSNFRRMGYRVVLDKSGAIVFFNPRT